MKKLFNTIFLAGLVIFCCNCTADGKDDGIPEGDYINRQAAWDAIPGWKFKCKICAEKNTVEEYGGRIEFMKKMDQLLRDVDTYYCIPGINDEGGNEMHFFMTEMVTFEGASYPYMYDDSGLLDTSYDVRIVVNGHPKQGDVSGGWLDPPYLAVGHDFKGLFEGWAIDALAHELGHSRGMVDLYAAEVRSPDDNPITGDIYLAPVGIMNSCYDVRHWTDYSLMVINHSAGDRVGVDHDEFLPYVYNATVKTCDGQVAVGAHMKFYPVYPYTYKVVPSPLYEGVVGEKGYKFPQNPFIQPNQSNRDNNIYNFFVAIEYKGVMTYRWMPIFEAELDYGTTGNRTFEFTLDY